MTVKLNQIKNCDCIQIFDELNKKLEDFRAKSLYDIWIPKKVAMRFFDYGETQMLALEKENGLITSKIKGRKFYSASSILMLIEKNITAKNQ
jgi:hypothetical protein